MTEHRSVVTIPEVRIYWVVGFVRFLVMDVVLIAVALVIRSTPLTIACALFCIVFASLASVCLIRAARRTPQVIADEESLRLKTWRGTRTLGWSDVVSVGPVQSAVPGAAAVRRGLVGGRSPEFERPTFMIRFGPHLLNGVMVRGVPDHDIVASNRALIEMWKKHRGTTIGGA
jgi:hypothetical protein